MSGIVTHSGVMAGSHTMLVFLPFLLAGAGLWFIITAVSDKVDKRPDDGSVRLPTLKERPLYHLHMQIRAGVKDVEPVDETGPAVVKFPTRR